MRQCIKNLHPRTSHEVRHISFYNFPSMTLHPRTFRKVRPIARYSQDLLWYLHPRTPVRCDSYSEKQKIDESIFTSTHLSRGATSFQEAISRIVSIYIHAPLARCDITIPPYHFSLNNLHPRTSREVRRSLSKVSPTGNPFTSTHLSRGATARYSVWRYAFTISRINIPTQIGLLANNTPYVPLSSANLSGFLVRFGFAQVSQIIISPSLHLKYLLHP